MGKEKNIKITPSSTAKVKENDHLITLDSGTSITLEYTNTKGLKDEEVKNIGWVANMFHNSPKNSKLHKKLHGAKATFKVPSVYCGGGLGWVEPVLEGKKPTFKTSRGYFINSIGTRSFDKIEWRDIHGHIIEEDKFFSEAVQLHIYTTGMYGHDIQVKLIDQNWWNYDLEIDENVKDETKSLEMFFTREVKVMQHADDSTSKVQKVVIDVRLDHQWIHAGKVLNVIPVVSTHVKGVKTKAFKGNHIVVRMPQNEEEKCKVNPASKSGNKPVIIGDIVTDVAEFKPCFFTKIEVKYGKDVKSKPVKYFDKQAGIDNSLYPIQVLAGPHETLITIELPDIDTDNCLFTGKTNEHKEKVITLIQEGESFKLEEKSDKKLKFKQTYPSVSILEFAKMAWLPNAVPIKHIIELNTCRYSKKIDIEVLPMLKYELFFKYMTDNPFDKRQTKAYVEKKYKGGKGLFTGKEKKKDRKKRKKDRQKAIKNRKQDYAKERKEIEEGSIFNYTNFEAGLEYSFGDENEVGFVKNNIPIEGEGPIFNAIDTGMWIINKLGSLCFKKEAEEAEKEAEEIIDNPKSAKDKKKRKQLKGRKKKRKNYLKKAKKVGKKLGKIMPFSIQIDQPVFAGAVSWELKPSTKYPTQIGKEYNITFKADPLIMIEGRLDLLFIATKIPYIGQAIQGLTATADAIDGSDDFWNWLVETFGGDDDDKINIDVDYHVDLFASGEFKVESKASTYHTIDGFTFNNTEVKGEFKFGIDCELRAKFETKKITSEAVIGGQAFAKFTVEFKPDQIETRYDGLFAVVYAKIDDDDDDDVKKPLKNEKSPKDKFKIHDGFTYIKETKIA